MNNAVPSESKFNVYGAVTEKIVEAIRKGAGTYTMPWHGGGPAICIPANATTEAPYRGVNILALWAVAAIEGYESGQWASYRQWQSVGGQVRRGERGSIVVFFKQFEDAEEDGKEEEGERPRLLARAYTPPRPTIWLTLRRSCLCDGRARCRTWGSVSLRSARHRQ